MMRKIIESIKMFKGICFKPFFLSINAFNGYSITVLSIEWTRKGKICMIGNSWCLFHIGFHDSLDNSFIFCLNILGFRKKWFVKPRVIETCPNCNHRIQMYSSIGTIDNEVYCDECESWINVDEVKQVKLYREGKINE